MEIIFNYKTDTVKLAKSRWSTNDHRLSLFYINTIKLMKICDENIT